MATWRAERTVCHKGELIFPGCSQNATTVFFFFLFGLFQILEFVEKPRKTKARERAAVATCPSSVSVFPIPPFPCACVGLSFFGFSSEDSKQGVSALGLVSASAAAACQPRPVASVEGWVKAKAGRHHGQTEKSQPASA